MGTHDIIDNRNEKLADHINTILQGTERAKFAVGYFFLSGFEAIKDRLKDLKKLCLLIGNTTNQATLEQLSEGFKRLELVEHANDEMRFVKRGEINRRKEETAENLRQVIELTDQTDDQEEIIITLARLIEEKRLKVRVYTKGRLHAKAYIFDYGKVYDKDGKQIEREEKGIAIVGSSNLTLSGVTHNTELNVLVQGNANHAELTNWFEELWNESQDFDDVLMNEIKQSWAMAPVRPYDIYMKTIYNLVKDRLEEADGRETLWDDEITRKLADFQKVAVRQSIQMIKDYGGAFISDVVGVGKSYIGAAVIKHFERTQGTRGLIICPKALEKMWESYNEKYQLNVRVLSMNMLKEAEEAGRNPLLEDIRFRDRNFVLVDESHNFRHHTTQRYNVLQAFLGAGGRRSLFLTATPRNKTAWDIYHQIKLFHQDDRTDLPIDPQDLKKYFKMIEKKERKLQYLLPSILIRRTRRHILRWYGYDSETHQPVAPARYREYLTEDRRAYIIVGGKHQFFPKRELETIEYSIEATYQGLYQQILGYLGRPGRRPNQTATDSELTYARYGLWNYVQKDKKKKAPYTDLHRAGRNLRGLMRTMLFKRFESSVHAFRETLKRLIRTHKVFLESLDRGLVPAGEDAQILLYESDQMEETELFDALSESSAKYDIDDFHIDKLKKDIQKDLGILNKILDLASEDRIPPVKDAKLQTLFEWLKRSPLNNGKILIFTQYADTAQYLFDNLNPNGKIDDIEVIYSGDKSKDRVVGRFAPKANPEYRMRKGEVEIETLIATDVLAEGLNLQDCDKVINYDLHWNPVRLIQRFGRIDRIGTEYEIIRGYNFLPETELDKTLGLRDKLKNRIQEIHETIGEDTAILDKAEQLNEEAMYAIYEKRGGQLTLFEEEEDMLDINEAEEMLRQLRSEHPDEFERIANLRDGVRTGKSSEQKGLFVFCQAGRYQQLFLADEDSKIITRDIPKILAAIRCVEAEKGVQLPKTHNRKVMRIKKLFDEEVKHRASERGQTISLTQGQRYVLRELRLIFGKTEDDDLKARLNLLEKAFRLPATVVVNRELNLLRRNGVMGEQLIEILTRIYHQHNLRDQIDRRDMGVREVIVPRIICSEALI
jgi:superfamily II DNA/RNA helicase/HKD family nuclease